MISTIGYEKANLDHFVGTLQAADVEVVVDIRDRAQSRRKGFSKTALSERLASSGIEYVHVKALGDPKEGRDAARSGNYSKFYEIFSAVMASDEAKNSLKEVAQLAESKQICLLCYERDHSQCHRKIVADELETIIGVRTRHLGVQPIEPSI
jgi:uncharacterized protein (DUF488 family)